MDAKSVLITELKKEVDLLTSWLATTKSGGWSTHLVSPMEKRLAEIKGILYDMGVSR